MKKSSIHSLQSSTTNHKLLESVRSLRPLLCEALRASGCDTIDINEQEPALHGKDLRNEDVQYLSSHASGQHHDAQCLHVKELANPHAIPSFDVNADDHILHVHPQVQHGNPEPQSHNSANDGDAVVPFADVQHYHDAHHHGHGKYSNAEYGHSHLHHGHGHEHGYNSNSIIVSTDKLPRITDYRSKLLGVQEQIVQNSFWHSFSLSCTQHPQVDNYHLLDHQHIQAYNHNRHLQKHISSETMDFLINPVLLEAPASLYDGSISGEALIGAEASNESNNNNDCIQNQESSAFAGHQANCRELPPLLKSRKRRKRLPKTMSKQLKSSDEEGGNIFSERRRSEALYAFRALVPTVSKNDFRSLQTEKEHSRPPSQEGFSTCACQEMETDKDSAKHKSLELDVLVVDMEQKTYHLSRCACGCKKEDLLKLTKALESLEF